MNPEPKKTRIITATMLSLKGEVPTNNSDSAAIERSWEKIFDQNTKRESVQKPRLGRSVARSKAEPNQPNEIVSKAKVKNPKKRKREAQTHPPNSNYII